MNDTPSHMMDIGETFILLRVFKSDLATLAGPCSREDAEEILDRTEDLHDSLERVMGIMRHVVRHGHKPND